MIGVFAETFIGESLPTRIFDYIPALLGTVITARLPIHVVIFQIAPSFFKLFAPEVFSSDPRIAPGKMIVVKTIVFIDRHPVPAPVTFSNSFVHP
jgi:hypothetical protein